MKGNWSDLLKGQEHHCDVSGQNAPAQETKLSFILELVLGMITRFNRRGSFLSRILNVSKLRYMWYCLDKRRKNVEARMIQRKINKVFHRRRNTNTQKKKRKGTERNYYWIRRLEKEHFPLPPRPCRYFWPRSASYLVGTRCSFSEGKAAGMWRWPVVFKRYRALGCIRNYLRSVYSLKSRKGFTFISKAKYISSIFWRSWLLTTVLYKLVVPYWRVFNPNVLNMELRTKTVPFRCGTVSTA